MLTFLIQIFSNMISRKHAIIEEKEVDGKQMYILTDLSLNGTYINDFRVFFKIYYDNLLN